MIKRDETYVEFLKRRIHLLLDWVKPDPADSTITQLVKTFFKSIVVLILVATSPIALIVLTFIFFITL